MANLQRYSQRLHGHSRVCIIPESPGPIAVNGALRGTLRFVLYYLSRDTCQFSDRTNFTDNNCMLIKVQYLQEYVTNISSVHTNIFLYHYPHNISARDTATLSTVENPEQCYVG